MDLKEAIFHARQVAEGCGGERDCAYQHDKLADWLEELEKYQDTGLTPEQVVSMKDKLTKIEQSVKRTAESWIWLTENGD